MYVEGIAFSKYERLRHHAWMRANRRNASTNALRHNQLAAAMGKHLAELETGLRLATRARLQQEQMPNQGRVVEVPKTEERALKVAELLAKQGALNHNPEISARARDLSAAIDRQRADKRAVADEFYGVPPKETPDA
jgi:hypothetical protein